MNKKNKLLSLTLLLTILLTALNASVVEIQMPQVPQTPEVPKVEAEVPKLKVHANTNRKTNAQIIEEFTSEKEVIFSDHVAPEYLEKKDESNKIIQVGDVHDGRVTAYLHAPLLAPSDVVSKLEGAGFEVLKTFKVDKKGIATSIIFTNPDLIQAASKTNRGFASVLHVTIDKKNKLISITNPIYVLAAFMQEEYDEALANKILETLRTTFVELKDSEEIQKFRILKRYEFMEGMPKYEDMQSLGKASNEELLENVKKSKQFVYEIKLLNGSSIVGVKLSSRTSKFVNKIGSTNAGLLPYPALIENGEVKILDPKYYIAIMYPMLKMSQFMTIATVPGAINKEMDKAFR